MHTRLAVNGDLPFWAAVLACALALVSLGVLFVWELRKRERGGPMIVATGVLAVGALALAVGMAAWKTITPYESPADLKAWLKSVAPRMVVTWGLCEGAAVVGGVTYFMTGDSVACGALSGLAVLAVIFHSPGKLATA